MNVIYRSLLVVLLVCPYASMGQSSKKETISFYKQLLNTEASEVKKGQHLALAKEMSADRFVQYYLEKGKKVQDKKYGDNILFEELYRDSMFAYFGRVYAYGLIDFVKVSNEELPSKGFIALDGQELRERFIDKVIPQEDKKRVDQKGRNCTSSWDSQSFEYSYIKDMDVVEIKCHWRIRCDFIYKKIDKVYVSRYSILDEEFIN